MHWYNVLYSSALQLLYTCKCTTFSFKSSTFGWPYISWYVSKWMHILYRTECYKILTPIVYTTPFQFKPKTLTLSVSSSVNVNQKRKRKCTKLTREKTLAPASFTFKWWEQSQTPLPRCDGGGGGAIQSLSTKLAGDIQGHERQLEKVSGSTLTKSRPPVTRSTGTLWLPFCSRRAAHFTVYSVSMRDETVKSANLPHCQNEKMVTMSTMLTNSL